MKPASQVDRREFVAALGSVGLLFAWPRFVGAQTASEMSPILFYMDGYHGGARGHMPMGCWRDIVEAMARNPEWKLSLDVEAASWQVLEQQDPETFHRLQSWIGSRVEITGATFSQPYGWAITGESNIRQLQYGLRLVGESFGDRHVKTYAVQEPCWASCLPQLLQSFGITGASLKNASTAWGGYTRGFDAELVNWIGPDGSSVLAVPRYECEALLHVWETEATEVSTAYAEKCVAHGIPQPAGMCFQDLGWVAQPRASAPWIRYATWGEYIHAVAKTKPVDWAFSMEDILTALPWGEKTLHRVAQQVREAEIALVAAEKLTTLALLKRGGAWPELDLDRAWQQTLWAQAHDAWITATTRTGRNAWAFQVASETLDASETAERLQSNAMRRISDIGTVQTEPQPGVQHVRVANTSGNDREDLVELALASNHGTQSFEVTDSQGNVLSCQAVVTRTFRALHTTEEGAHAPIFESGTAASEATSINAATLLFRGRVPAFGWNTFRVTPQTFAAKLAAGVPAVTALQEDDGSVVVESDLYRIRFDAKHGGAIASLYAKQMSREFCPSGKFLNAFRGYFVKDSRWHESSERAAHIEVLEAGPIRSKIRITGAVGGCPFRSTITVQLGQPRIDCQVSFKFDEDTWIGDPWDIKPEDRNKERRRSSNDGRWKLQAIFPVADGTIYKNSAFDICKSRNASTHFQRWDEIKHNIIVNWVDLMDATEDVGFALLSDRTTAYSYGDNEPLGLILGWGGEGGFWWGRCPLRGEQESTYAILPHRGAWSEAQLWQQNLAWEEPLRAEVMPRAPGTADKEHSLIRLSSKSIVLSSATVDQDDVFVRLFNPQEREETCRVEFGFHASACHSVELNGDRVSTLPLKPGVNGRTHVELSLPKFRLRTLKVRFATR